MKHPHFVQGLIAAICLAVPATGFSSTRDRDAHPAKAGERRTATRHECGSWYRGHYYGGHYWGPRVYVGGPFFWGPPFAFTFYTGPGPYPYYDGPAPGTYRGVPVGRSSDGKGVVEDNLAADVQHALTDRGFYHGPIDGEIGSGSRAAIRAYQQEHGLDVNGRIDNALLRSLHID